MAGSGSLNRRAFLATGFALRLCAQKPEVSSFDLSLLDEPATPNELFFVREHFPAPAATMSSWKLTVRGAVAAPLEVSYDELTARPRKSLGVTLECAENPAGGGLVSHAEWAGISLLSLLQSARPLPDAGTVRLTGADGFSRSIPLAKAQHEHTLLAHTMNGEKLPPDHGFPLRAVIPGWYGMDAVKWLRSIDVLAGEVPPTGYARQTRSLLGLTRIEPVTAMNVKSAFSRPVDGAVLFGRRFVLRGAAWAGEHRVREVKVSLDKGKTWEAAKLDTAARPYVWVRWSYDWKIAGPGIYELVVTATDEQGRTQSSDRPAGRIDEYELNQPQFVRVTVS